MRTLLIVAGVAVMALSLTARAQRQTGDANLTNQITQLERAMWEMWKNHKYDDMRAQMTEDALIVGADSLATRDTIVEIMKRQNCEARNYTLSDVKVTTPAPDTALIAYHVVVTGTCGASAIPANGDMTGTLWVRRGGRWLTAFHQQTPYSK